MLAMIKDCGCEGEEGGGVTGGEGQEVGSFRAGSSGGAST